MFARVYRQNKQNKKKLKKLLSAKDYKLSEQDLEKRRANEYKGQQGERRAGWGLRFFLPRNYILINDVVIEVTPNDFIQIDHLVISNWGIFLIETKNWTGDYDIQHDKWVSGRLNLHNPVEQLERSKKLLQDWLKENNFNIDNDKFCKYYILYNGKIGKNNNENTVSSSLVAARKMINSGKNIDKETIDRLVEVIVNASPIDHWEWIKSKGKVQDRRVVSIEGSIKEYLTIKAAYEDKGFKIQKIKDDGKNFEFELSNHFEHTEHEIELTQNKFHKRETKKKRRYILKKQRRKMIMLTLLAIAIFVWLKKDMFSPLYQNLETNLQSVFHNQSNQQILQQVDNRIPSQEPCLVFMVNEKQTYIMLKERGVRVISEVFNKGTKITVFPNKNVTIQNGEKLIKTIILEDDQFLFEAANRYTSVISKGKNINSNRIDASYNFSNGEITLRPKNS